MPFQKRIHLVLILLAIQRARAVHHSAALLQIRSRILENRSLQLRQLIQALRRDMHADLRLMRKIAKPRTWRIDENPVHGFRLHSHNRLRGIRCSAGNDRDSGLHHKLFNQLHPLFMEIQGCDHSLVLHLRGNLLGLGARGCTGIQHAHAWFRFQQPSDCLRGPILDEHLPFIKPRSFRQDAVIRKAVCFQKMNLPV